MDKPWSLEYLADWVIEAGLQPRVLDSGNGVIVYPPGERKAIFTIYIAGVQEEYSAEIAINKQNVHAISLQEALQEKYDVAEPKTAHKWPRVGLVGFSSTALELIAEWARERVTTPWSPQPTPVTLPVSETGAVLDELPSAKPEHKVDSAGKEQRLNKWLASFLSARGIEWADGRPLYAYKTTDDEFQRISKLLQLVSHFRGHEIFRKDQKYDALFVLFAAEWWRREYHGGPWSWSPIFKAAGLSEDDIQALQSSTQVALYPALERGFRYWKREIFYTGQARTFIGSIAAEGGLPLNLLGEGHTGLKRFFKHLLDRYLPVRASGVPASQVASELQKDLPASFRRDTVFRVAGEIVEITLDLRGKFDLAGQKDPVAHLDKVNPVWRDRFPLSLDNEPAQALLQALVVDAARSSDTGVPLSLNRYLIKEACGQFRLQAVVDISRKISIASLMAVFGDIDWPSQLEIWLMRPFKARMAVLSRIDNDHYKARNDTVRWAGADAVAEAAVGLFSYGSAVSDIGALAGSLLEDDLPWIFVEKDNHLRYLGQGGMSLAAETTTLIIPNGAVVSSMEAGPDRLGNLEEFARDIYQTEGEIKVRTTEGEFTIRTRQPKLDIPQYQLTGTRYWGEANVHQVFLGIPKLHRQNVGGATGNYSYTALLWRHAGSDDAWQHCSSSMEGVVDIKAVDGKEVLYRSRIGVLPEKTDFEFFPGREERSGEIRVAGVPGVRFVSSSECVDLEVQQVESESTRLLLTRNDESCSSFQLHIQWPHLPRALSLMMPIPVAGARFRDGYGNWLDENIFLSISDLSGVHAVGFNHSGGTPECFNLDIGIRGMGFDSNDIRTLSDRIPLPRMGQISELPLIQLRDQLQQLFSLSEDLDFRIELTLAGNHTYRRLKLARYTCQLQVSDHAITLDAAGYRGSVEQCVVDDLVLEVHSLLNPIDHGRELKPCLTQDVPTGEWYRPKNIDPGPWLVMPAKGRTAPVRPSILVQPGYIPSGNGRLRDAIATHDERERRYQIGECIQQMLSKYEHKDWGFVFETLEAFQHLPATTFDLWDCFAANHRAMAMLLIRADETQFQQVIDLANELPFAWELVPYSAWMKSLLVVKDFVESSALEAFKDSSVTHEINQKLSFVAEADVVLEKVAWILSEMVLGKPVDELKKAKPFSFPGVIDGALNAESIKLRGRQGADVFWPVFRGRIIQQIRELSPDPTQSLYTHQAEYMQSVLHAPIAVAIRAYALPDGETYHLTNTELYQLQLIRHFDEDWYKDAFELTVLYLYAIDELNCYEKENDK